MLPRDKENLGIVMLISSHNDGSLKKFAKLYCVTAGYSDLPEDDNKMRQELDNAMFNVIFNKHKLNCILTIKKYFPSFRLGPSRRHE